VTIAIQVDGQGAILAVRIVDSDPAGVFDDAAIESVRAWRFEPATRDGVPVTTWVRQTIRFTLEAS
jgi:TonB family protein